MSDQEGERPANVKPVVDALGFSVRCAAGAGVEIVFQGHLPINTSKQGLNNVLDKLVAAAERQALKVAIADLTATIENETKVYDQMLHDIAGIDQRQEAEWKAQNKQGAFKPSTKQQQEKQNALTNQKRYEDAFKKFDEQKKKLEDRLKKLEE